jgi:zinc protease
MHIQSIKIGSVLAKTLIMSLCISLATGPVFAQECNHPDTSATDPKAVKSIHVAPPQTCETLLPNGLKLVVFEDHSFPVVSCLTWYKVGAKYESPGSTGISHLLEHLLFGTVGPFRKGEIAASIARLGGQFNGFTSDDFTAFFETLPANKVDLALRIESQRMRNASFTDSDVHQEISNIQTEFETESKDPMGSLSREVRAALYQQHPYHNPTMGWRTDVENINAQQVKAYYDKFFWPDNCTVVVAGDVSPKDVIQSAQQYFGNISKAPVAPSSPKITEQAQHGERRIVVKYPGKQEVLQLAYHAPAMDDPDAPAMVVLEKLLNMPLSGRLKKNLIEAHVCSSASATFEIKKDPGLFTLTCTAIPAMPGAQQKINDAADGLINQIKAQLITDGELKRAKNQAEFTYFAEAESPYRAGFHLGYFDSLSKWQDTFTWPERLRAVTIADIQRVAKRYLNSDARVVAWLAGASAPKSAAPKNNGDQPSAPKTPGSRQFEHTRLTGFKDDDDALSPEHCHTGRREQPILIAQLAVERDVAYPTPPGSFTAPRVKDTVFRPAKKTQPRTAVRNDAPAGGADAGSTASVTDSSAPVATGSSPAQATAAPAATIKTTAPTTTTQTAVSKTPVTSTEQPQANIAPKSANSSAAETSAIKSSTRASTAPPTSTSAAPSTDTTTVTSANTSTRTSATSTSAPSANTSTSTSATSTSASAASASTRSSTNTAAPSTATATPATAANSTKASTTSSNTQTTSSPGSAKPPVAATPESATAANSTKASTSSNTQTTSSSGSPKPPVAAIPESATIKRASQPSVENAVDHAIREIPDALPSAVKQIPTAIGGAPGAIKDIPTAVQSVPTVIKNLPSAVNGLPSAIKQLPSAVESIPSAIREIPGAIGGLPGAAVNAVRSLPSAIGGLPGTAASTMRTLPGAIGGIPGAAASAIGGIPGAAASAVKSMPAALGTMAAELGALPSALGKQLIPRVELPTHVAKRVLKNGMTVIVYESHLSPMVHIEGAVRAGSAYEPATKPGLAALTASILSQGTAKRSKSQLQNQQEDIGLPPANMLRFTDSEEFIEFQTRCLSRDLSNQLELIGETLSTPASSDADIERAKTEVIAELKQVEDGQDIRVNRALLRSLLTTGSPFSPQDPSEVAHILPSVSTTDAKKFLSSYVAPTATTIVMVGDIDIDRAAQLAEHAFESWTSKGTQQKLHAHANPKHISRTSIPTKDKTKATVCFGQLVPVVKNGPEYGGLLIADAAFSGHPIMSRLNKKMSAEPAFAQALADESVETDIKPLSNSLAWSFTVTLEPSAVPSTVQNFQSELKQLARSGVTPEEFNEVRRYLLGYIPVHHLSNYGQTARSLMDASMHSDGSDNNYFAVLNSLRLANVESVNKIIRNALRPDQTSLVVMGPPQSIRSVRNQVAQATDRKATSNSPDADSTNDSTAH